MSRKTKYRLRRQKKHNTKKRINKLFRTKYYRMLRTIAGGNGNAVQKLDNASQISEFQIDRWPAPLPGRDWRDYRSSRQPHAHVPRSEALFTAPLLHPLPPYEPPISAPPPQPLPPYEPPISAPPLFSRHSHIPSYRTHKDYTEKEL